MIANKFLQKFPEVLWDPKNNLSPQLNNIDWGPSPLEFHDFVLKKASMALNLATKQKHSEHYLISEKYPECNDQ